MEVRHSFCQCSAMLVLLLLLSMPLSVVANPSGYTNTHERMLLAGPIGKSSSASARVTLIIPPKPTPALQVNRETTDQEPSVKTGQNTEKNNSEN